MSFKLKSLDTVHRYQSDLDPDKGTDKAVTFLIRTLPRKVAAILAAHDLNNSIKLNQIMSGKDVTLSPENVEYHYECVRLGLCGWENLDNDGKVVEFKLDPKSQIPAVHPDLLEMLPAELVNDIATNGVIPHNFPKQEKVKN